MNRKEYTLLAEVFQRHRSTYGGRTDSVTVELLADLIRELQGAYPNFNRDMFIEACMINEDDGKLAERLKHYGL